MTLSTKSADTNLGERFSSKYNFFIQNKELKKQFICFIFIQKLKQSVLKWKSE